MRKADALDEREVRQAVVEITRDGIRRGTGFFITDELVVTCDHVASGDGALRVRLASGEERTTTIDESLSLPEIDVCVLSVAGRAPAVMRVALESPSVSDALWTLGFHGTASITDALPATGTNDGPTSTRYESKRRYDVRDVMRVRDLRADFGASGAPLIAIPEGVAVGITIAKYLTSDNLALPFRALRGTPLGNVIEQQARVVPAFGRYLNFAGARDVCAAQREKAVARLVDNGQYLPDRFVARTEMDEQISAFLAQRAAAVLPITGASGVGKSSLLARFASGTEKPFALLLSGHRVSIDRVTLADALVEEIGGADDLDHIARIATDAGEPLVVLFDALNEVFGPPALLRAWMERMAEWITAKKALLIVSARDDCWRDVAEYVPKRMLFGETNVSLGDFSDDEARQAAKAYGVTTSFRRPIFLRLYADLGADSSSGRVNLFVLLQRYVADRAKAVSRRLTSRVPPSLIERLLEQIGAHADRQLAIAKAAVFDDPKVTPEILQALLWENLLLETDGGFRFVFDEVGEYLLSKSIKLPPPDAAKWKAWLDERPQPGPIRFAFLSRELEDAPSVPPFLQALADAVAASDSYLFTVYRDLLVDLFARLASPPVQILASYFRQAIGDIENYELKDIVLRIQDGAMPLRDRLEVFHALAPIQNYYPWREKDWSPKPVDMYTAHPLVHAFARAFAEDAPATTEALVGWLDDEQRLRGDGYDLKQDGESRVSDVATALLYHASDEHLALICRALGERVRGGGGSDAEYVLRIIGRKSWNHVEPVIAQWEAGGADYDLASMRLLTGVMDTKREHAPAWVIARLLALRGSPDSVVSSEASVLLGRVPEHAPAVFKALSRRYLDGNGVSIHALTPFSTTAFEDYLAFTRALAARGYPLYDIGTAIRNLSDKTLSPSQHEALISFLEEFADQPACQQGVGLTIEQELHTLEEGDPLFERLVDLACRFVVFGRTDGRTPLFYYIAHPIHEKAESKRAITEAIIAGVDEEDDLKQLCGLMTERYHPDWGTFDQIIRLARRIEDRDRVLLGGALRNEFFAKDLLRSSETSPSLETLRGAVAAGKTAHDAAFEILMS